MSFESTDKKNTLQSIVDGIQTHEENPFKSETLKGYVPNPDLKSLRTFQGDMQEHIEVKKETVATIAIAEQKKKIEHNEPTYTEPQVRSSQTSRSGLFVVVGIICLIIGGTISGAIYFLHTKSTDTPNVQIVKTLISFTEKKEIVLPTLEVGSLAAVLLQEQGSFKSEANSVLYTAFTNNGTEVKPADLFRLVAKNAGDALKRNISDAMFGIYSYNTNEIFIMVRPEDFGIVYSGMLDWESTLGGNMSSFFPLLKQHLTTNPSIFTDETYKNKDVRVIRNESGKTVLLYGFIDKSTLVITANENIFEAILSRYLQQKLSR